MSEASKDPQENEVVCGNMLPEHTSVTKTNIRKNNTKMETSLQGQKA